MAKQIAKLTLKFGDMPKSRFEDLRRKLINPAKGIVDTIDSNGWLIVMYDYSDKLETEILATARKYHTNNFFYDTVIY